MAEDLQFKVSVSADTAGLKQTETALRGVTDAAKDAASEFKGFTDEQKKQAQQLADSLPPLKKTATEAENLTRTLGGTKAAVSGLGNVLGGIFSGDLVQAGRGLLDLSKAATAATGAMQAFLGSVARGAAVGAAFAAPVLLAMYKWRKEAEAADAEMQAIWANQGKSTRALAEAQEAEAARIVELNKAVAESYKRNTAAIDEQTRATQALNAEKTKRAVAKAGTPEEARNIQNAADIAAADLDVQAAIEREEAAGALGDPESQKRAANDLALARSKRETLGVVQTTSAEKRSKEISGQMSALSATGNEQQAASDWSGLGETRTAYNKLRNELKALNKATAGVVNDTAEDQKRARVEMNARREAGSGGG